MRKFLIIAFVAASFVFVVPAAEAKTIRENVTNIAVNNEPQRRYGQTRRTQRNRRIEQNRRYERNRRYNARYNNRNRVRVAYRSRIVRRGYAVYRETYQIRYLPNGRTLTRLVSRVRLRR